MLLAPEPGPSLAASERSGSAPGLVTREPKTRVGGFWRRRQNRARRNRPQVPKLRRVARPALTKTVSVHTDARYYEPTSGRFLSADPMGQAASPSLYDFCAGDPVNYFDPTGRIFGTPLTLGEYASSVGSGLLTGAGNVGYAAVTAPYRFGTTVVSGYQQIGGLAGDLFTGGLNSDLSLMASHPISTLQATGAAAKDTAFQIATGIVQQAQTSEGLANLSTDLAFGLAFGELAPATRIASNRPTIANYLDQGFTPTQAEYLTQPYSGMGEHLLKRAWLDERGLDLPDSLIDSGLNVLSGEGMTIGEFYERHFQVDSDFAGTGFPRGIGGSWSGDALGLDEFGPLGKLWYGTPEDLLSLISSQASFWSTHRNCPP